MVRLNTTASACLQTPALSSPEPSASQCQETSPQLKMLLPFACRVLVRCATGATAKDWLDISKVTFNFVFLSM